MQTREIEEWRLCGAPVEVGELIEVAATVIGAGLLLINAGGLFRGAEVRGISDEHIHFKVSARRPTYREFLAEVCRQSGESELGLAVRLNSAVASRLVHIHWHKFPAAKFDQRVSLFDNWILWGMGVFGGFKVYQRYHFTDWRRSAQRGIGVCGDKSMVLEQLLKKHGIECNIISNARHVFVEATIQQKAYCFDPDYGVFFPYAAPDIPANWSAIEPIYIATGANPKNIADLPAIFGMPARRWQGTREFVRRRYLFERASYVLKWTVPMCLCLFAMLIACG